MVPDLSVISLYVCIGSYISPSLSARWSILFITLAISIFQVFYHLSAVPLWTTLHLSARSLVIHHGEKNSPDTLLSYQVMATGTCNLPQRWKPPPSGYFIHIPFTSHKDVPDPNRSNTSSQTKNKRVEQIY